MANIRVKAALARIETELQRVYEQIAQYSGIDKSEAVIIDNTATSISSMAADIAGLARQVEGNTSGTRLHKQVRKALGFTTP
jgi:hypothetical protein